jgi:hypothetical protein
MSRSSLQSNENLLLSLFFFSINRDILPSYHHFIIFVIFIHLIGQGFPPRGHRILEGVAVHFSIDGQEDVCRFRFGWEWKAAAGAAGTWTGGLRSLM